MGGKLKNPSSCTVFDAWVSYIKIMKQCDPNFDLKVNVSQHHGLVILLNIFKIIWWMNIIVGIMDHVAHRLTLSSICRSVTYILWCSDFASYLEDYLMEKCCSWAIGLVWLKDRPCKIYVGQWHVFHGPLILPYIIVILDLYYFYTLRNGAGWGFSGPSGHLL